MNDDLARENTELRETLEKAMLEITALWGDKVILAKRCRLLEAQIDKATHRIQQLLNEYPPIDNSFM